MKNTIKIKNILLLTVLLILLTGCKNNNIATDGIISEDEAKDIVLDSAGISENDISKYEIKLKYKDNTTLYEIELEVNESKYEYRINAVSGKIIEFNMNIENDEENIDKNKTDKAEEKLNELDGIDGISEAEAIDIALNDVSADKDSLVFFKAYIVKYDGKFAYHIKFKTKKDYIEYDYIVDIETGNIAWNERN